MTDSNQFKYKSFNTKDYKPYYPGEAPTSGEMTAQRTYTVSSSPNTLHDGFDSNGIGQAFAVGDRWHNLTNRAWYTCEDNSQEAARWIVDGSVDIVYDVATNNDYITSAATFYSVSRTDVEPVDLTLPSVSDNIGVTYTISDTGASSSVNNITVSPAGGDTIIGDTLAEASAIISSDGAVLRFIGINENNWKVW